MIILDGRRYETRPSTPEIMARAGAFATLMGTHVSSQAVTPVTWKRRTGGHEAKPTLLLTREGDVVAFGEWEFGAPVTLARGMLENLLHDEPSPKRSRMGAFMPPPPPCGPDEILNHIAELDQCRYTMLERVYEGFAEDPKILPPGEFRALIVPPGHMHNYFVFMYANIEACLSPEEHMEAALRHLEHVETIGPEYHQRMGAAIAKMTGM